MPETEKNRGEGPLRPRGRRAAPKSAAATALAPVAPYVTAVAAWLSNHRLAALIAATSVATVGMIGGGIAVIQSAAITEPDRDAAPELDDLRPTTTEPADPSPFGPILPTPVPPPPMTATPTPEPDEIVEPPVDDGTVVEPTRTARPEPEPEPDTGPGRGNGPKKPKP